MLAIVCFNPSKYACEEAGHFVNVCQQEEKISESALVKLLVESKTTRTYELIKQGNRIQD